MSTLSADPMLESETASLVALGSFNPAIFHPVWFSKTELLPDTEAESAQIEIVSNQISIFKTDWLRLEVTAERLVLRTEAAAKYMPLKDLFWGILHILAHTPLSAFGYNWDIHYQMPNEAQWHKIGDELAPKTTWKQVIDEPGLKSLAILGKRNNTSSTRAELQVGPSTIVRKHGIYLHCNQHYDLSGISVQDEPADNVHLRKFIHNALDTEYSEFLEYRFDVLKKILTLVGESH